MCANFHSIHNHFHPPPNDDCVSGQNSESDHHYHCCWWLLLVFCHQSPRTHIRGAFHQKCLLLFVCFLFFAQFPISVPAPKKVYQQQQSNLDCSCLLASPISYPASKAGWHSSSTSFLSSIFGILATHLASLHTTIRHQSLKPNTFSNPSSKFRLHRVLRLSSFPCFLQSLAYTNSALPRCLSLSALANQTTNPPHISAASNNN